MKNKHWSQEDKDYLSSNYKKLSISKIGKVLDKSDNAIRYMASELGLTDKPIYWRQHELRYLCENYTSLTIKELSAHLKRSEGSVRHKLHDLKVTKTLTWDVDTSPIQDKIPFYKGKAGEYRELLNVMIPGQSFEYPKEERQTLQNQIRAFPDRFYRTRDVDEKVRRVWRLL